MGGVSTSVSEKHSIYTLKVSVGVKEEYIITRHGQFDPAINVINLYGAQESRQTKEEIIEGCDTILEEILKIEGKNESVILLGDLNRHLSNNIVKDNHDKNSLGGKLLSEFVSNGDYTLVNALDCVEGGPFTRYDKSDPSNDSKKSLLDIVVVSSSLVQFIDRLRIDNKLEWTPSRSVRCKLK